MQKSCQAWERLGTALLGVAFWLAFPAVSAAACEGAVLDDSALTLLEVTLGDSPFVLEDVITAYQMREGLYVPLGALTRSLDFPIETRPISRRAQGWFLNPNRTFVLDLTGCRVSVEERGEKLEPNHVAVQNDDIYVHETLMEQWFPLELEFDPSELRLVITALEPLPLQQRLEREQRWERQGARGTEGEEHAPVSETPYRFMDWPFVDASLESRVHESETGERIETNRYKVVAAGDFLKMNAQVSVAGMTGDALDSFVTLSRRDPRRNLLGPLKASEFAFGDIGTAQDPLIANNVIGRGFHVSNLPLDRPQEFDRFSLRGELPLGWDVELYRNGQLVAFQSGQAADRYDFTDIPLDFGVNRFRLVFYGPQGQIREETIQRIIGQGMIRPGEHHYRFTAVQERDLQEVVGVPDGGEHPRFSFGYDYGLSRAFSIGTTARRLVLDDVERDYLSAHTNLSLPGAFGRVEYASQVEGGSAVSALLSTRIFGLDVTAESSRFEDFDSERVRSEIVPGDLLERNELRLRSRVRRLGFGMRIEQTRGTEGERFEAQSELSFNARLGTVTHLYETDLTRLDSGEARRARQHLLFSTRRGPVSLRGEVVQELLPEPYIRNIGTSADWAMGERAILRVGAVRNPLDDTTTYSSGISWLFDHFSLGMNVSKVDSGEMAAGLVLSGSFVRDPVSDDWRVTSASRTPFGALAVHVFLDNNGNGSWETDEPPIPNVRVSAGGVVSHMATNPTGYVFISGLPSYEITEVSVDPTSLDNPFWRSDSSRASIVPRPGRTARLQLPIIPTGSIEGTVLKSRNEDFRVVPGERVYLLSEDGQRIDSTVSAYDGYYYFDGVPPGFYRIRLARDGLERAYDPDDMLIEIDGEMGTIGSIDLLVRDVPPNVARARVSPQDGRRRVAERPSQSAIASTGYTIQLVAASSEAAVQNYISAHRLTNDTFILQTSRNGRPWYQVIFGRYLNPESARAAIRTMPAALKRVGPFIRPLSSVTGQVIGNRPAGDPGRTGKWLLSRPGDHYTVQLAAVQKESDARAFIERHDLSDSATYFETRRGGTTWYSIVLGEYPGRAEATKAAASLPAGLRETQPWIRSFRSIQDAIRTN